MVCSCCSSAPSTPWASPWTTSANCTRWASSARLNCARAAGLHVGDVLTWENSAEAVRAGAKSMEVEGLAKPMAARLMTLARPGQILLSAVAESLTRRATDALGERGARLLWKSHGRWRFKGVPVVQEVIEVGEIGSAPLRMPRANAKARRDLPLWRQPLVMAAEGLILAAAVLGGWLLLRSELPLPSPNVTGWCLAMSTTLPAIRSSMTRCGTRSGSRWSSRAT